MTHTLPGHFNTTNIIYLFSPFVHKPHYFFVVVNGNKPHYLVIVVNGYVPHYLFVVANGVFSFVTRSRTS